MDVAALVSVEEYLHTDYSPDREYVDGVVVEREVGQKPHSRVQRNLIHFLSLRYPALFVWPEQRVRTIPGRRWRIPDVCVTLDEPPTDVFETPPFLCIEIVSSEDRISRVIEKLEEYQAFGVPHIWVIDPLRSKAFFFRDGLQELKSDGLTAGDIRLPLSEVFDRV